MRRGIVISWKKEHGFFVPEGTIDRHTKVYIHEAGRCVVDDKGRFNMLNPSAASVYISPLIGDIVLYLEVQHVRKRNPKAFVSALEKNIPNDA